MNIFIYEDFIEIKEKCNDVHLKKIAFKIVWFYGNLIIKIVKKIEIKISQVNL